MRARPTGGLIEDYRRLRLPEAGVADRASLERWQVRWGQRPVRAITSREIDLYLRELALKDFTRTELGRERSKLASFFGWLQHSGFIASNPLTSVAPPPERPQRAVIWSPSSQRRLLVACRKQKRRGTREVRRRDGPKRGHDRRPDEPPPYLCPLVLVALETGLRLENLLYLGWQHIDLITNTLRIPASEVRGNRALEFKIPPASARFLHRLWEIVSRQRKRPALVFEPLGLPRNGGAPNEDAIHEELLRACCRAGVPPGDFDSIRKTFAWNNARSGTPFLKTATIVDWGDLADLVDAYHQDTSTPSLSALRTDAAGRPSS